MIPQQQDLTEHLTVKQLALFEEDLPLLEDFVARYNVSLLSVEESTENPPLRKLMYFFDDNLGGYTVKGIRDSLDEKVDD